MMLFYPRGLLQTYYGWKNIYKKVNYPFHFSLENLHLDKSVLIFQQGKN